MSEEEDNTHPHFFVSRYFQYTHLPPHLQVISRVFCAAAQEVLAMQCNDPQERMESLRKLLEAKDCAVRMAT